MSRTRILILVPPVALAFALAALSFGKAAHGIQTSTFQKRRVALRGPLTPTKETLQVVTWQTPNKTQTTNKTDGRALAAEAHLAVETTGRNPHVLWQIDGGATYYRADSVQTADLDSDGVVEIISLWWAGASAGAALRVFHWDKEKRAFVELSSDEGLEGIHRYRVTGGRKVRLITYVRPNVGAGWPMVPGGEYGVRGSEIVRIGNITSGGRMNDANRSESGIEGQAVITPMSPVLRANMPKRDPSPYEASLIVVTAAEGREVARLKTGPDGRFRVALPPGQYVVKPQMQGRWPRAGDVEVTVEAGKFSQVTITFDSGMR